MEVVKGRRVCREVSPERGKECVQTGMMSRPMFKKVQVVYYLSRNGHLEHPHYMEVTHLAHQQLRLKDVMDRLRNLRGKAMPSFYSWSCKRSYKNGYVWNDLAENDAIHPSEGTEYVLKGSELVDGCTERLHQLQLGNGQLAGRDSNLQAKGRSLGSKQRHDATVSCQYDHHGEGQENAQEEEEEEEEEEEYEEKTSNTSSIITSHSRCSRGVSTDEIQELKQQKNANGPSELSLDSNSFSSPPSTTSSSVSETVSNNKNTNTKNNTSKRFEDGDPVGNEPLLSRNSMLLSLIACGGSGSFRKTVPPPVAARKSNGGGNIHKGVVCKMAANVAVDEEEMMIGCMSENPRFGNFQAEEKEYFSGSIVESTGNERVEVEPALKKSSSHNEEMSTMTGLGEAAEEEVNEDKGAKGKCIPRKKSSSSKQSKK